MRVRICGGHIARGQLQALSPLSHCTEKGWYKCLKYSATISILSLFPFHGLVASQCLGSSWGWGHHLSEPERGWGAEEQMVYLLTSVWKTLVWGLIITLGKRGGLGAYFCSVPWGTEMMGDASGTAGDAWLHQELTNRLRDWGEKKGEEKRMTRKVTCLGFCSG